MGGSDEGINQGRSRPLHDLAHFLGHVAEAVGVEAGLEAPEPAARLGRDLEKAAKPFSSYKLYPKLSPGPDVIMPANYPARFGFGRVLRGASKVLRFAGKASGFISDIPLLGPVLGRLAGPLIDAALFPSKTTQETPSWLAYRRQRALDEAVARGVASAPSYDLAKDLASVADAQPLTVSPDWGLEVTRSTRTPRPTPSHIPSGLPPGEHHLPGGRKVIVTPPMTIEGRVPHPAQTYPSTLQVLYLARS
jgi:hypothetical protein